MQFYKLDKDPTKSSQLLPDYALKKVNLREGYQILSDIGHILNFHWEGQNKLYSASHALTRHICSSKENFLEFIMHYMANRKEYFRRFNKRPIYDNEFTNFLMANGLDEIVNFRIYLDEYVATRYYLLDYKSQHLTDEEKVRLVL